MEHQHKFQCKMEKTKHKKVVKEFINKWQKGWESVICKNKTTKCILI